MSQLAQLMHLIDSSLPTGSFAYSAGLESSINFKLIDSQFGLRNYFYSFLQQVVSFDFPFINSVYSLEEPDLNEDFANIAADYDASLLTPTLHKASLIQAKNWNKLLITFYPDLNLGEITDWFSDHELPLHYLMAFSLNLKRVGFSIQDIKEMHLHMNLRDQMSAAIRLGFIGPMEGHKLQHNFYSIFDDFMKINLDTPYYGASRSAFLLDMAQVYHEDIYSKLFQN